MLASPCIRLTWLWRCWRSMLSVTVVGADGHRTIAFDDFYVLAGDNPQHETVLRHGELIVGIELPASPRSRTSRT